MSIHIELPAPELSLLRQITRTDNDAEAVVRATREFIRLSRLRELKSVSGKVELNGDWQGLEELELAETEFPQ
jgi:hypothetical protein